MLILPTVPSTRLRAFSRSDGHNAARASAYRAGAAVTDHHGEVHDFSRRRGVLETHLVGWSMRRDDRIAAALTELWSTAQDAEAASNAVEAREFRFDLPGGNAPEWQQVRKEIALGIGRKLRGDLGVAVQISLHAPGEEGDERNWHCHAMSTDRKVRDDGTFSSFKVPLFQDRAACGAYLNELRAHLCMESNRAFAAMGVQHERWDHRTYREIYAGLNAERTREGLERLEVPRPMQHEGPAVTAQRRKAARVNAPPESEVAAANDRIRAESAVVHQRNRARIARDPLIRSLRLRLLRLAELDELIARAPSIDSHEYGDYVSRHTRLMRQVGGVTDLRKAVVALPSPARELLREAHPQEVERASRSPDLSTGLGR
ncbi:MAG TPA: MobA/MobL family protein [Longimicrobiaceae bacterium]|nr:MobA/MobL family protein [Longimicrobiaceae bacterium]